MGSSVGLGGSYGKQRYNLEITATDKGIIPEISPYWKWTKVLSGQVQGTWWLSTVEECKLIFLKPNFKEIFLNIMLRYKLKDVLAKNAAVISSFLSFPFPLFPTSGFYLVFAFYLGLIVLDFIFVIEY